MKQVPANYKRVENSERRPRAGAKAAGPADPKEVLTVSIRIRRRPDGATLPDPANVAAAPAGERSYFSREDFAAHFGASQEDIDKVVAFGHSHGLKLVEASIPRRTVVLSGTVAQMEDAFAVELKRYESPTEKYRGREGHVHLPADLTDIVEGVFGLDNRQMARPLMKPPSQKATPSQGGPAQNTVPLTPPQVASLYQFPSNFTASGQTIGLLEFGGGFKPADIHSWYSGVGFIFPPTVTAVGVDGATNSPGSPDDVEVVLDIDVAGSAGRGANIAVYFAPWTEQGWVDVVTKAIHDNVNKPSVISISWGWPELESIQGLTWTQQAINAVSSTFQEAAALGVTILAASGDHGSDCGINDKKAHVLYPASDPYVTACGGTSISNVSGSSFTETTWNDGDDWWLTGGGVSDIFPVPVWQNQANVPGSANDGHKGRAIPDIAGNADGASGYDLIVNGAHTGAVGGTSATAPLYAGLVALLNAGLGEPVGYLNPNLYAFKGSYVYRDIADNATNARGGAPGYKAGAGWDGCTGLGVANGSHVLDALNEIGEPPALADFNGKLFMVWKGLERDDRIFLSTFDGANWAAQQQIAGIGSSTGVSLAVFNKKLYMAWKGVQGDEGIYYSFFDGKKWAAQKAIKGIGTSNGPQLAVLGNKLYMGWKGVMGDQRMFFSSFDGANWAPQVLVPNLSTSGGPALATYKNELYMVYSASNVTWVRNLLWAKFNGSNFVAQPANLGIVSGEGASLAVFNNALYQASRGSIFVNWQVCYYSSFAGANWTPEAVLPNAVSSVGPGLGVFGNALYAAWKGQLGDQAIYFAHFDGANWSAAKQVPGVGTSPDLVMSATG